MKRPFQILVLISLATSFTFFNGSQALGIAPARASLRFSGGLELFSRTVDWDGKIHSSKIKAALVYLEAESEIQKGFSLNALLGYSSSNFNGLIFRQLPFSIDYQAGGIGGVCLGAGITKIFISSGELEIGAFSRFVTYLGLNREWEIPDLNVENRLKGRPYWMMVSAGPEFTYTGLDSLSFYLRLSFNKLWGKFKMDESVANLVATEEKRISSDGLMALSLGSIYQIRENLSFAIEASVMPYKTGADLGARAKTTFSF